MEEIKNESQKTEEEKNPLKWLKVKITFIGENEEKTYEYNRPWKINAIKNFTWRLSDKAKN